MAAMVILSMSLIVLMDSQGQSMNLVGRAQDLEQASLLAKSKMVELTEEATTKGITSLRETESGEFDQTQHPGYLWRYWIAPIPSPDFAKMMGMATEGVDIGGLDEETKNTGNAAVLAGPLQAIGDIWGKALREVHVEVTWGNEKNPRSYDLVTHLIAPEAITQVQALVGMLGGGPAAGNPANPQTGTNPNTGQKSSSQPSNRGTGQNQGTTR
ncbi:MAG TPA: hypothetical protein VI895_10285 [Bdellovibrionota bacterium]|nr:hypothetical protein [Bdellovibrionota bacterium]